MKSILILATVGGFLPQFELNNVRILQEMGYIVHYAADMEHPNYKLDRELLEGMQIHLHQIPIVKSPFRFLQNGKALREVLKIIRGNDIQAVHCHTPAGGLIGRMAGMFCGRKLKVVYTAHGFHFYRGAPKPGAFVYRMVEKILARFTDILVVINQEDYQSALGFYLRGTPGKDRKGGQVYRIPGVGIDLEAFSPLTEKERAAGRRKLGLKESDLFLVSVGELNENKNQYSVLLALDQMRREGKNISHIRYGICGDGVLRDQVSAWIQEMGLEKNVAMYGYCDPVQPVLGCADAFLFPSRREGLGMAALEALSMGIPVIAADNRGTREYMEPGKNGYVCRWDDVDGYIRGIESVCSMNRAQREAMGRYCRISVQKFETECTVRMMRKVYRRLDEIIEENHGRKK